MILSVFCKCKDVKFITLVILLDNYVPLVLNMHSIVFKCDKYDVLFQSVLNCRMMFVVFKRRRDDKELLVMLSTFLLSEENFNLMHETIQRNLVLRRRTNETDTGKKMLPKPRKFMLLSMSSTPSNLHFSSLKKSILVQRRIIN